eukprot:TRINITY_DN84685_c0_g1_i1.p1 TRINITY_DN84685_c0_g1~~TRINITY_DN84685_c0_g1_i1.p1  ORF type:complete len:220 (-),score=17.32 TRINITY_DN84685_c0_g1_i1:178-777(-)
MSTKGSTVGSGGNIVEHMLPEIECSFVHAGDVLSILLHTIFWQRTLVLLEPDDQWSESVQIGWTKVRHAAIEKEIDAVTHKMIQSTPHSKDGIQKIVQVQFLRTPKKSGGLWPTKSESKLAWEKWFVRLRITSNSASRADLSGQVRPVLDKICDAMQQDMEQHHVPKLDDGAMYPFEINLQEQAKTWGASLLGFAVGTV